MTRESWVPIPGYEGRYSVSDLGRVRSESRTIALKNGSNRRWPGSILKPYKNADGYLRVDLWADNRRKIRFVHHLVLQAFVGQAPPGTQACHCNGGTEDNRLENLRWRTRSANTLNSVRNGRHHEAAKTHCKWGHEFTPENTRPYANGKGRQCRTCLNAWHRAKRRGMTLGEYMKSEDGK